MLKISLIFLLVVGLFHSVRTTVVSEDGETGSIVSTDEHDDHDHDSHGDAGLEGHDDHEGHDHEGHDHDDHKGHDHDDHDDDDSHADHADDETHKDHESHDHTDGDHEDEGDDDHEGHDHGDDDHEDEGDDGHDDHEDDDHDDHEGHDHGDHDDHKSHDHGDEDHEDDDHDDHEGHDHGDEDHDDHEGHDHDDHEGHDHGDHYEKLLQELNSENMNKDVLSQLIEKLRDSVNCRDTSENICKECITADGIITAVGITNSVFSEVEVEKISWILVHYMSTSSDAVCVNETDIVELSTAKDSLFYGGTFCQHHFQIIAGKISNKTCTEAPRCLEHTFEEGCMDTDHIEDEGIMTGVIYGILMCRCELPKKEYFTDHLFDTYTSENGTMTASGFQELLTALAIGGEVVEVDEHEGHNHRRKREIDDHDHDDHDHDHEHDEEDNFCYSADELFAIFNIDSDAGITAEQFTELSPALVQQVASKICVVEPSPPTTDSSYTTAQKYGYGTASVLIISSLAFLGLLFFPIINTTGYKLAMQFFIALGVGTMSGDALLHIIPEVVGLHAHAPGEIHEGEEEDKTYMWRLLVVIGGIYLFFLFESTVRIINQVRNVNITLHVHDHGSGDHDHTLETGNSRALHHTLSDAAAKGNGGEETITDQQKKEEKLKQEKVFGDFTTVALMVLIGDILHNFGDGLAIGVAFSTSWVAGIGTSIAIFCHELPHEFGDFAIYLNSGLSKCKALFANFTAACFAFIGLYIGLAVASNSEVREWILAAIAGMFLYICFVDVLHEMIETKTKKPIIQFAMQNLGLLLGWAILLVIAIYEDQIIGVLA